VIVAVEKTSREALERMEGLVLLRQTHGDIK